MQCGWKVHICREVGTFQASATEINKYNFHLFSRPCTLKAIHIQDYKRTNCPYNMENDLDFVKKIIAVGAIKLGEYILKTNVPSPIYIDLRNVISYPEYLRELSEKVWDKKVSADIQADVLCGVPYTALPLATAISIFQDLPMILKRKEAKDHGTKKVLEGKYEKGQTCLIIEDVVTSGSSVIETAEVLRSEGLIVKDCIVILDRQQGGKANLEKLGINLHSLFELRKVVTAMSDLKFISRDEAEKVFTFLDSTNFTNNNIEADIKNFPLLRRADLCTHPLLKKLFKIMHEKQTNLCVAMDVVKSSELVQFAEVLGPHICLMKTNIDILGNYSSYINKTMKDLAKKHDFLILEDRKFADIGNTVRCQYEEGLFKIKDYADIVTVQSVPGDGVIEGLKLSCSYDKACFLIAQMSCNDSLISADYIKDTVDMAERHKDFVIGFVSQSLVSRNPEFIHISPAVSLVLQDDPFGEMFKTLEDAIKKDGADIVIVGKAITRSRNIVESVQEYKKLAFKTYLETISSM